MTALLPVTLVPKSVMVAGGIGTFLFASADMWKVPPAPGVIVSARVVAVATNEYEIRMPLLLPKAS